LLSGFRLLEIVNLGKLAGRVFAMGFYGRRR
jgi:hypothetical protein